MVKPCISVIVPVYNVKSLLPRCIDSLLDQTYVDFELLLIDDGSTDGSGDVCDEYKKEDHRIKVFHKQNEGVSKARNKGLDEATGKWITFVDSDDYVTSSYLSDLYACAQPEVDLVVHYSRHIKNNGDTLYDYLLPQGKIVYGKTDFGKMLKEQYFADRGQCHSKLFRTNIIKENAIRFICDIRFCEDWIFLFSYLNVINQNVCCSSVSNYFYIDRNGSLCHSENGFVSEYNTFCIIKNVALEFCTKYNVNVVDLGPTYMLHKAITLVSSKKQLSMISDEDWCFFIKYFRATSMKTTVDKWVILHFYKSSSLLFLYFYLVRNFRKLLEKCNLWVFVDILRK